MFSKKRVKCLFFKMIQKYLLVKKRNLKLYRILNRSSSYNFSYDIFISILASVKFQQFLTKVE